MLGLLGAFFVTTNMNFKEITVDSIKGNLLTLCSGVLWTVYIIISKKHLEKNEELTGMTVFFGTTVWSAVFLVLITPFVLINKSWNTIVAGFTWKSIGAVVYLAIVCTVVAFALYMEGLKKAKEGESSVFMLLEVVIAFLLEWIIFSTIPEMWTAIGAEMIVLAVLITSIKFQKHQGNVSRPS